MDQEALPRKKLNIKNSNKLQDSQAATKEAKQEFTTSDQNENSGKTRLDLKNINRNSEFSAEEKAMEKDENGSKSNKYSEKLQQMFKASLQVRDQMDTPSSSKNKAEEEQKQNVKMDEHIQNIKAETDNFQKVLENRQVELETIKERALKKSNETLNLKKFTEKIVQELKTEQDEKLKNANLRLKNLTDQLQQVKDQIKDQKKDQKQKEESIETLEEQKMELRGKLNDIGSKVAENSTLEHCVADFDHVKKTNERLKVKSQKVKVLIDSAKLLKTQLEVKNELLGMEKNTEKLQKIDNELGDKLQHLKEDNQILFKLQSQQIEKQKVLQEKDQVEGKKKVELVELVNLLKDQNEFEKLSRKVQVRIENLEDKQRLQEDSCSEILADLAMIEQEIDTKNDELVNQLRSFSKELEKSVGEKDDLKKDTTQVMKPVCNKEPSEISINLVEDQLRKMQYNQINVEELEGGNKQLQDKIQALSDIYHKFESDLKKTYHGKSEILLRENEDLIFDASSKINEISVQIQNLDSLVSVKGDNQQQKILDIEIAPLITQSKNKLKLIQQEIDVESEKLQTYVETQNTNKELLNQKEANAPKTTLIKVQSNILEYFRQYQDTLDQNETLKKIFVEDLDKIAQRLGDAEKRTNEIMKSSQKNQEKELQEAIEKGKNRSAHLNDKIQELLKRLDNLASNANKLDNPDKDDINGQIEKVKRDLNKLQDKKDKIDNQIRDLESANNGDLGSKQQVIDDLLKEIDDIYDKNKGNPNSGTGDDVKSKEKEVDSIEDQIRKGIREKRNNSKGKALKSVGQIEQDVEELNQLLQKIDEMIKEAEKSNKELLGLYKYADFERNNELKEKLVEKLAEAQQDFHKSVAERDRVTLKLKGLQKDVEDIQKLVFNCPTLTEGVRPDLQDEVSQKWEQCFKQSVVVVGEIDQEKKQAKGLLAGLEAIQRDNHDLQLKYAEKDTLYNDCKEQKKDREDKVEAMQQELLASIQQALDCAEEIFNRVVPFQQDTGTKTQDEGKLAQMKRFDSKFQEKQEVCERLKGKFEKLNSKNQQFGKRIKTITQKLPLIGLEDVFNTDLQTIKNELEKLKLEMEYEREELNGLNDEAQALLNQAKQLEKENLKLFEEANDAKQGTLEGDLASLDLLTDQDQDLLNQYKGLIKQGLALNDAEITKHLQVIYHNKQVYIQDNDSKAAAQFTKDLKQLERLKELLKSQEREQRQRFNECKLNPTNTTSSTLYDINQKFNQIEESTQGARDDLQKMKEELEQKIAAIQDYLNKYKVMAELSEEMAKQLGALLKNVKDVKGQHTQLENISEALKGVLLEMEKGISRDYKSKESFIVKQSGDLEKLAKEIKNLLEKRNQIAKYVKEVNLLKDKKLKEEDLIDILKQINEISEELRDNETGGKKVLKKLQQMKKEVGDADLPELVNTRDEELKEYSKKLKTAEVEYQEVKRKMAEKGNTVESYKSLEGDIKLIEPKLQVYREDRVKFKRVLNSELRPVVSSNEALSDLNILKTSVETVIELGDKMAMSLECLTKVQQMTGKLKRDMENMDLLKKLKDLTQQQMQQEESIQEIKNMLSKIQKGGLEVDGYASNTEEATFIVYIFNCFDFVQETLISELPEIKVKFDEAEFDNKETGTMLESAKEDINKGQEELTDMIMESLDKQGIQIHFHIAYASVDEKLQKNQKTIDFLSKLLVKLSQRFEDMDIRKKLQKRQMELQELGDICADFDGQLQDLQMNLQKDIKTLEQNRLVQSKIKDKFVDEDGKPVNLLEEVQDMQIELVEILDNVDELQVENEEIQEKAKQVISNFENDEEIQGVLQGEKVAFENIFRLLKKNGKLKKKIIDLIKALKEIRMKMKDSKSRYQLCREKIEKQGDGRKIYKAVKGDVVDELFAEYINSLNCPVPIKRLGNNYYTFGTKKIYAKVINGKLVIRVGGGYMGIEEFMMYYGEQELTKIQKQEMINMDEPNIGILDDQQIQSHGTNILSDSENEELDQVIRKSAGSPERRGNKVSRVSQLSDNQNFDIDVLKSKIKEQSNQKQRNNNPFAYSQEESKSHKKQKVIGIGDVRKAMKSNLVEIQTHHEQAQVYQVPEENQPGSIGQTGLTGFKSRGSVKKANFHKVPTEKEKEDRQLRNIEKRIGDKLKKDTQLTPTLKGKKQISVANIDLSGSQEGSFSSLMKQDFNTESQKSLFSKPTDKGLKTERKSTEGNQHTLKKRGSITEGTLKKRGSIFSPKEAIKKKL